MSQQHNSPLPSSLNLLTQPVCLWCYQHLFLGMHSRKGMAMSAYTVQIKHKAVCPSVNAAFTYLLLHYSLAFSLWPWDWKYVILKPVMNLKGAFFLTILTCLVSFHYSFSLALLQTLPLLSARWEKNETPRSVFLFCCSETKKEKGYNRMISGSWHFFFSYCTDSRVIFSKSS